MRIAALLTAVVAAATAAPSHAAQVRPCGAGYVGVVVSDSSGDRVTACVYAQDVIDAANAAVTDARAKAAAVTRWATRDVPDFVRSCQVHPGEPTIAECDEIPFPEV